MKNNMHNQQGNAHPESLSDLFLQKSDVMTRIRLLHHALLFTENEEKEAVADFSTQLTAEWQRLAHLEATIHERLRREREHPAAEQLFVLVQEAEEIQREIERLADEWQKAEESTPFSNAHDLVKRLKLLQEQQVRNWMQQRQLVLH